MYYPVDLFRQIKNRHQIPRYIAHFRKNLLTLSINLLGKKKKCIISKIIESFHQRKRVTEHDMFGLRANT